ncbi:MAG: hypothetical protein QME94_14055 [Anaerolineae bacterium]|nr:hypothetical protein [Anaerolineae bacterium]
MVNVTWHNVVGFLTGLAGFGLALLIAAAVIWLVRAPLKRVLAILIGDKALAEAGSAFVLLILGLHGLRAALSYITQPNLSRIFGGLTGLLLDMAGVLQWAAYVGAILFVGYSLQARRGAARKDD